MRPFRWDWRLAAFRALSSSSIRRQAERFGRFAYASGRVRYRNDPATNGEVQLQRDALRIASSSESIIVLDIGANVGNWSTSILDLAEAEQLNDRMRLAAFEPVGRSFGLLENNLLGRQLAELVLQNAAVSDSVGSAYINIYGPTLGINSLEETIQSSRAPSREKVETTTATAFAASIGAEHIDLMKIDTEGHDLLVIRGALALIARGAVSIVQFEYNHRWMAGRHLLADVFELVSDLPYAIGYLSPRGIVWTPDWTPQLEDYFESNYVLVRKDLVDQVKVA